MTIYDQLIEKLMQSYTSGNYASEVSEAKAYFFESAGIFNEESADLEMKMTQFMDWYLFNRELKEKKVTPIQAAVDKDDYDYSQDEETYIKNLSANRHSIFEFLKTKEEDVYIKDLFSDYKMILKKSPVIAGFSKEELFEARLIPHEDSFIFSKSFCIHPAEAKKFILGEIKKVKKMDESIKPQAREELIFRLFKMRHKLEQYRHVQLTQIYSNESKLRL